MESSVKFADVKLGDELRWFRPETDCLEVGRTYAVEQFDGGELCIFCKRGRHFLYPDEHGDLNGFARVSHTQS